MKLYDKSIYDIEESAFSISSINENYTCKDCNIKCKITDTNENWNIPDNLLPSEKQVNCINIINNKLNTNFKPLIKSKCIQFIKENMGKSKNINN